MTAEGKERKLETMRSAFDLDIIQDNILDIAEFTIEKHEFKADTTLSPEMREEAISKIKDALLEQWEETRRRIRREILENAFSTAESALHQVLD